MGSLFSPPKVPVAAYVAAPPAAPPPPPPPPPTVPEPRPAPAPEPAPSPASAGPAAAPSAPAPAPSAPVRDLEEAVRRTSRGRAGTVATGWRGLLLAPALPGRKSLLGE